MVNAQCSASSSYILETRDGACCCRRPYSQRGRNLYSSSTLFLKREFFPSSSREGLEEAGVRNE